MNYQEAIEDICTSTREGLKGLNGSKLTTNNREFVNEAIENMNNVIDIVKHMMNPNTLSPEEAMCVSDYINGTLFDFIRKYEKLDNMDWLLTMISAYGKISGVGYEFDEDCSEPKEYDNGCFTDQEYEYFTSNTEEQNK